MYQQAATLRKQAQTLRLGRLTTFLLLAITAAGLPGCDEKDPTGTDLTTSSDGGQIAAPAEDTDGDSMALASGTAALVSTIPLPINQSKATSGVLFGLTQTGTGPAGVFKINNTNSNKDAILAQTNGGGGTVVSSVAVHGISTGAFGSAGLFEATNGANFRPALIVRANHRGIAGEFDIVNATNDLPALEAASLGTGAAAVFDSRSSVATLQATNTSTGFAAFFRGTGSSAAKGVLIETQGGAGLQVVGGSKNAVVHTPSGAKALYTEESTEVWFTDYGFGKLANGRARVLLDPSFAQTINPDERYHVFLQAHGRGELYVTEMTPLGFEVALNDGGDANAEFSYRIVAKRLGFEGKRLEAAPWADRLPARD
jgi:hypothetical protein